MSLANLVPRSDRTGSLGTPSKRWDNIYASSMSIDNVDLSGSFSGSFFGNGGSLTGIVATVVEPAVLDFTTGSPNPSHNEGRVFYDDTDKAMAFMSDINGPIQQIGQENWVRVYNGTGVSIPDGAPVELSGSSNNRPNVRLAWALPDSNQVTDYKSYGVATHEISASSEGFVTTYGFVGGINTSGWNAGDTLYISSSIGELTNTKPPAPYESIQLALVVSSSISGRIFVTEKRIREFDLQGIHLQSGDDVTRYGTISESLSNAAANDVIMVGPGTYVETNLEVPTNVRLLGKTGASNDVIIYAFSSTNEVVLLNHQSTIGNMMVIGPNNSNPIVNFSSTDDSGSCIITNCRVLGGGGTGPGIQHNDPGYMSVLQVSFANAFGSMSDGIHRSGSGVLFARDIIGAGTATNLINLAGTGDVDILRVLTFGSGFANYDNGIRLNCSSSVLLTDIYMDKGVDNSFYFQSGSDGALIQLYGGELTGETTDIKVDPTCTGLNTRFYFNSVGARLEKFDFGSSSWIDNVNISGLYSDQGVQDDNTIGILGQLSVGIPEKPSEAIFGEGDSTTTNMIVLGSGSNGWNNYTDEASNNDDINFTLFPDSGSNSTIYIGNTNRKFIGLRTNIVIPQTGSIDDGIWEYSTGSTWVQFNTLNSKANFPFTSAASLPFTQLPGEQTRFSDIYSSITDANWTISSVSGSSAYWVRYRLLNPLTGSADIQRIKLGTNRTEINSSGVIEYFGEAEPKMQLVWHRKLEDDLAGSSPSNENITYSSNVTITAIDNAFQNNTLDGNAGQITIPDGLDTSRPITFTIYWTPLSNGSGDVELELRTVPVKLGDTLNGGLAETLQSDITSINAQDNVLLKTEFTISVPNLLPGEFLAFSYFRDAGAGNAQDTFSGGISIINTEWSGYFWK